MDINRDFEQVQELYRTLLVMEGAHPLLERVELFLDKPRPLTFNKERYAYLDSEGQKEPYESLLKHERSAFWTNAYPLPQRASLQGKRRVYRLSIRSRAARPSRSARLWPPSTRII
ncbi:hypothetical protein LJK87_24650 [Paenibacillus sp. P25]|nr:hypothetical protein LJK87_24650 [Paenibacillus sp. P25]